MLWWYFVNNGQKGVLVNVLTLARRKLDEFLLFAFQVYFPHLALWVCQCFGQFHVESGLGSTVTENGLSQFSVYFTFLFLVFLSQIYFSHVCLNHRLISKYKSTWHCDGSVEIHEAGDKENSPEENAAVGMKKTHCETNQDWENLKILIKCFNFQSINFFHNFVTREGTRGKFNMLLPLSTLTPWHHGASSPPNPAPITMKYSRWYKEDN